jgi:alpha-galactosidase
MPNRRSFLEAAVLSSMAASWRSPMLEVFGSISAAAPEGFVDLRRAPDRVSAQTATGDVTLATSGREWSAAGVTVRTTELPGALRIQLSAPAVAVKALKLRWRGSMPESSRMLGDAWERGYGDLEWRGWVPDRSMPWYAAVRAGSLTHVYGVRTGARACCYWLIDPQGLTLVADVRSGGNGVQLGDRALDVCDVLARPGKEGETAFAAIHEACRLMCPNPRLPATPIFGSNDWYWAYGKNTADTARGDAQRIVEVCPSGGVRPFAVIDDGWQPQRGRDRGPAGAWDRGNDKFGEMSALAADLARIGTRPGIWIRPLLASPDTPDGWRLPRDRNILDPTIPDVRRKIAADISRLREWGYELIKHDYTTFDIAGRWGSQMGASLTRDGWTFASGPGRTTAEVIDELYRTIRDAAGPAVVIGCNTVSHLSAGHFQICRVGDDTSGTEWARTRKMGVNTLAFRGVQHGAFYVADADCVGVTNAVPWSLNRQWLDLLARSGTMLFVSLAPDAIGADERKDLQAAFTRAAVPHPLGEPLDWERNVYPTRWRLMGAERAFDWTGPDGA